MYLQAMVSYLLFDLTQTEPIYISIINVLLIIRLK